MDERLISVVIAVHNGEAYLAEAIESVLDQRHESVELIVVDDGSTDATRAVAVRFASSIRYHLQPNRGTGAARNAGVELARGSFLTFLDHDDLFANRRIERQMARFEADGELDLVTGLVKQFVSPELDARARSRARCPTEIVRGCVTSAMLMRRAAFERVGHFNTELQVGTDMEWYMRFSEAGLQVATVDEIVLHRRIHNSNKGITERDFITQRAQVIKAALDRRRGRGVE